MKKYALLFLLFLSNFVQADDRAFGTPPDILLGQSITAYFKPMIKNAAGYWNYATQAISPTPTIAIKWYQNGGLKATATGTTASPTTFTVAHWGLYHTFTPTAAGFVVLSVSQYISGNAYNDAETIRVDNIQNFINTEIAQATSDNRSFNTARIANATALFNTRISSVSDAVKFGAGILQASDVAMLDLNVNGTYENGYTVSIFGLSLESAEPNIVIVLSQHTGVTDIVYGTYKAPLYSATNSFTYYSTAFKVINGVTSYKKVWSHSFAAESATGFFQITAEVSNGTLRKKVGGNFNVTQYSIDTSQLITLTTFKNYLNPMYAHANITNVTLYTSMVTIARATAGLSVATSRYVPANAVYGQSSTDLDGTFYHILFDYDSQRPGRYRVFTVPGGQSVLQFANAEIGSGSLSILSQN